MATFYVDSSALVKRYAVERGTGWVLSLTDPAAGHALYTVRLTHVEVMSALSRKVRTREVSAADARRAEASFAAEWQHLYRIMEVSEGLVERATSLAQRYPLRGYDAVHLAAALALDVQVRAATADRITLVSADQEQLRAAESEGLLVDDPNDHL